MQIVKVDYTVFNPNPKSNPKSKNLNRILKQKERESNSYSNNDN